MTSPESGSVLDWPALASSGPGGEGDEGDTGEVYARYAEVYDAFFGDIRADAQFYLGRAGEALGAGGHVLEIGSGTGRVAEHFLREGYRVTGVDASQAMLDRAGIRLAGFGDRYEGRLADVRTMAVGGDFGLVVAPYGMVAHLLSDEDRLATFQRVRAHLRPGGSFIFDDMPGWLAAAHGADGDDGASLAVRKTTTDPVTEMTVRLMSNTFDVADKPYSVRYDFIDWLDKGRVARRKVIRVVFRNISLEAELALLAQAGLGDVRLYGGFDGRPFDAKNLAANERVVVSCRRVA